MNRIAILMCLLLNMQSFASQTRECIMPDGLTVTNVSHEGKNVRVATKSGGYVFIDFNGSRYEYNPKAERWDTFYAQPWDSGTLYTRGKVNDKTASLLRYFATRAK